jgi:hypothetical protein
MARHFGSWKQLRVRSNDIIAGEFRRRKTARRIGEVLLSKRRNADSGKHAADDQEPGPSAQNLH